MLLFFFFWQVIDDTCEPLIGMGFDTLQSFEEITNSPDMCVLSAQ